MLRHPCTFPLNSHSPVQFRVLMRPTGHQCSVWLHWTELVPVLSSCQQLEAWNGCRFSTSHSSSLTPTLSSRHSPHWNPWQRGLGIFASESISLHAGHRRPSPPTCSGCPVSPFPTVSSLLFCSHQLDNATWAFTQPHAHRRRLCNPAHFVIDGHIFLSVSACFNRRFCELNPVNRDSKTED